MKTVINWSNENIQIQNNNGVEVTGFDKFGTDNYSPVELLTGSLGLCVFITITKLFERDGVTENIDDFSVAVDAKKSTKGPSRIESFSVTIQMPEQLDASYRMNLLKSAERACTIGNTLKQGAEINVTEKDVLQDGE